MKKKRALITGINGMDGSHLADFLLKRGDYEVFGIERRKANYYSPNISFNLIINFFLYIVEKILYISNLSIV
jgi:GDPmannose 4,6-dehydratase